MLWIQVKVKSSHHAGNTHRLRAGGGWWCPGCPVPIWKICNFILLLKPPSHWLPQSWCSNNADVYWSIQSCCWSDWCSRHQVRLADFLNITEFQEMEKKGGKPQPDWGRD